MAQVGSWELVGELARGGAGAVYRAKDAQGREAALKLLLGGASASQPQRARFVREARALARLHHPGLVRVLDAGESVQGIPYLAMELVHGQTLAERLREEGTFPPDEAVALARQVALALAHAHEQGVLHRDVKPSNVLLRKKDGAAVLTDFGLTRDVDPTQTSSLTTEGRMLGTPGYWAPEQARGEVDKVGPAADVYGLGATLYALLTGGSPQGSPSTAAQALDAVERPAAPPSHLRAEVDRALDAIILRCLELDPGARWPDAGALADELARWETQAPARAAPTRGHGRPVLVALALLLVGVGLALGLIVRWRRAAELGSLVAEVNLHIRRGDETAARAALARAVALAPGSPLVIAARGHLATVEHRDPEAKEDVERALALDPDNALALACRAFLLRDGEQALADGRRATELAPQDPVGWNMLGIALEWRQQRQEARAAYDRAHELDPLYLYPHTNRSRVRLDLGDPEGALADAERAIELDPAHPRAWVVRAQARKALGDREGAWADYRKACQVDPGQMDTWVNQGHLLVEWGRPEDQAQALECYERAAAIAPDDPIVLAARAQAKNRLGRPREALVDFDRALELTKEPIPSTHNNRGLVRWALGDREGALADFDRAVELDSQSPVTWSNRAELRMAAGLLEEALSDCNRAIELGPDSAQAWLTRFKVHRALGRTREMSTDAEKVVQLDPDSIDGRIARSLVRLRRQDFTGAREDVDVALARQPDHPFARMGRAYALAGLGRREEALADARQALTRLPEGSPDARELRAFVADMERRGR